MQYTNVIAELNVKLAGRGAKSELARRSGCDKATLTRICSSKSVVTDDIIARISAPRAWDHISDSLDIIRCAGRDLLIAAGHSPASLHLRSPSRLVDLELDEAMTAISDHIDDHPSLRTLIYALRDIIAQKQCALRVAEQRPGYPSPNTARNRVPDPVHGFSP